MVLAVSEERLSRRKHDNRLDHAFSLALATARSRGQAISGAAFSTCSDSPWTPKTPPRLEGASRVAVPSHHYSHALSAFLGSPFRESLVLVADAGGNTLFPFDSRIWWSLPREQTSLWYGVAGNVHLLERRHFDPFHIGYGEWYRAITYFLGWHSHTLSGNTMALSAYGNAAEISNYGIWDEDFSGTLGGRIHNDPRRPIEMTLLLLNTLGAPRIRPRQLDEPLTQAYANVAAYLQMSLENSLIAMVEKHLKVYRLSQVCLSGGVAQNCVAGAKLASRLGRENVFISAYSGDVGQCVGNALYARLRDIGPNEASHGEDVFVGPIHNDREVDLALADLDLSLTSGSEEEIAAEVAQRLAAGYVVGVCRGRSEFGPRALGNRSVLCDPCQPDVVARVKRAVKERDDFMPLAPVIDQALTHELGETPASPTMTFAPQLPEGFREEFGKAMHIDDTARLQLVAPGSFFAQVLATFMRITGRRVLINTSFNRRGEPIVESPADALRTLNELAIDCLVLQDRLVLRTMLPQHRG
ncbi:MAG TPA: carbamoyltransferase C-terminal domain-containing protein [Candidatus Bathyarchaeia archaeon]